MDEVVLPRFRLSLGARFTLAIGVVILTASVLVFAIIYRLQEEQALAQLDTQAKALLSQMVMTRQWVADYGGIWTTAPGEYWWSERNGLYQKTPAMVTKELSKRAEASNYYRFHITSLKLKNPENAPSEAEREALHGFEVNPLPLAGIEMINGERMYRYMIPLQTTEACLQCHADQGYRAGDIRGGLSVTVPITTTEATLTQNRQALIVATIILVITVMSALYILITRLIVHPIHQLRAVTSAVGQGNYDVESNIHTGDELETLNDAINNMVRGLKRSRDALLQKIDRRNREVATLSNIALILSGASNLDDALRDVLAEAASATGSDGGVIYLWDVNQKKGSLAAVVGLPSTVIEHLERYPAVVADSSPTVVTLSPDSPLRQSGYHSLVVAPLRSKNHLRGALQLFTRAAREFNADDLSLLSCIGNQIGVAVENAYNAQRVEQMAILEERHRLAREIHDSLAQTLGYLNLKTELLESSVQHAELDRAREEIVNVRRVVREACYDVRESIDGLRARAIGEGGLIQMATDYLREFGQRTALATECTVSPNNPPLSPVAETEVLRIIQEALTNVRKHAQAKQVRLKIGSEGESLHVEVADDGKGFNPAALAAVNHFGVRIMRERAERLGGQFEIESETGGGTRVRVCVPYKGLL
jgi:two-component system nitrate/nitrite sensor histidine kinase NarX